MFGMNFLGPLGMATMGDGRPDNSQADMSALQKMLADTKAANRTPNGRVARGWDQFSPMGPYPTEPMLPTPPTPGPPDMGGPPPALSTHLPGPPGPDPQPAAVPMPMARPPEATQTASPEMGFFQRNAAMMQDPSSGAFIDPEAASRANASGPDVIQKLLNYFHQKA